MNNQELLRKIKFLNNKHQSIKQENDRNIGTLEYLENQLKEKGLTLEKAEKHVSELNEELTGLDRKIETDLETAEDIINNLS